MRGECPICERYQLVKPVGPRDSPIIIVGPYPGYQELKTGVPGSGPAGRVLRKELYKVNIRMNDCRVTNFWLHQKPELGTKKNPNEFFPKCYDWCMKQLKEEMNNKQIALITGAETVRIFFEVSVMQVTGCVMESPLLPGIATIPLVNPAQAENATLGELRLGLERMAELARKL